MRYILFPLFLLLSAHQSLANDDKEGTASSKATTYGLDCSFPIHQKVLGTPENCGGLEGRQEIYDEYMAGCRDHYDHGSGEGECDWTEDDRLAMTIRQPQSMVNFTATGYKKLKAPESLRKLLNEFWEKNKDNREEEYWFEVRPMRLR